MLPKTRQAMKLFYGQTSPFARKVRIAILELGLQDRVEGVQVNPWSDESLRAVNPLCQVPTLVTEGGEAVFDSTVICDMLNELGGGALIPAAGDPRRFALTLQAIADGICDAIVRRVREGLRPEEDRNQDMLSRQAAAVKASLDMLEGFAGRLDGFGVGEISVACACDYLDLRAAEDRWREGRPGLAAWYAEVSQRPSMRATEPPATPPPR